MLRPGLGGKKAAHSRFCDTLASVSCDPKAILPLCRQRIALVVSVTMQGAAGWTVGALVHVGKIVPFPTIRIRLNVNAKVVKLDHTSSPLIETNGNLCPNQFTKNLAHSFRKGERAF
ncbi:hypothetical protein DI44_08585 [Geobacillus sp. CAMR5420]|nr:hypothetical protein DI44_08585 [Geobacillus sp. CAMR5420]